jgi:hypothetical protein
MKRRYIAIASLLAVLLTSPCAQARVWTDESGKYTLEADLVTANDRNVVLKRPDHEMVAIPIEKLSEADREFLKSDEAAALAGESDKPLQKWTLVDGTEIEGRIVEYAQREVTLQRRRGRIYINDRVFENLPEFYQNLIPQLVAQSERLQRADRASLEAWLVRQRGQPVTLHLEGVILEAENGDEYAIPFSMFSEEDLKLLKPRWEDWQAAASQKDYQQMNDHAFLLRSLAAARNRDRQVKREIAQLQLGLQAVQAGLTSLWEVTLYPAPGRNGRPLWVIMPGRNSRQATEAALERNPGYVAGPVRRVSG